ncbi:MAG: hypothetical protein KGQ70_04420, partial [Alphaproteobacteria bacterium]|nr:hypothetical protein [Alphaproteobacteria bacterium]
MARASVALLAARATPALAGFTWLQPPPAPVAAAPAPAPAAVPQMPAQKVAPIQAAPLAVAAVEKKAPPADNLSGFASGVPLSLALQQVVPARYDVVLGHGVRGRTHVSWQGGKPWEQVLSDMLAPAGLDFSLSGEKLTVKRSAKPAKGAIVPESMVAENQALPEKSPAPLAAPIPVAPPEKSSPEEVMAPPVAAPASIPAPPPAAPLLAAPQPEALQPEKSQSAALPTEQVPMAPLPPAAAQPMAQESSITAQPQAQQSDVIPPAWRAQRGETLKTVLDAWARAAHVRLYWAIDYD